MKGFVRLSKMNPACSESLSRGVAIERCASGVSWVVKVSDGSEEAVSVSERLWVRNGQSGRSVLYLVHTRSTSPVKNN
ncbi:unnamed protein product [Arctogadus glacialis]